MWRIVPGQQLHMHCWDGECVLYNDLSGDTHLLGEGSGALLRLLARGPAGEAQLLSSLQQDFEFDPGIAAQASLSLLLDGLARLDMIETVAC